MSTDLYDKYGEAYLKCEKLRRDLRELHRQKESLRNENRNNKDSKTQEIQNITNKEQETEIELRKAETILKTEENTVRDSMNAAKDSSWSVEHDFAGKTFLISLTKSADGKGYLNVNKKL